MCRRHAQVLAIAKNVWPSKVGYIPIPIFGGQHVGLAGEMHWNGVRPHVGRRLSDLRRDGNEALQIPVERMDDVTRVSGGSYAVSVDDYWSFTQFGSKLLATNINDNLQVLDVDSGATNFSDCAGTPPRARYVTVVGDFAVLASLSSGDRRVRNSAINDSTGWTVGTNLCDEQEFADGGRVTGLAGGEYGRVVQEKSIRRMIFQPGSDQAFRFERVENEHGAAAGYSLASTANTIYFLANDGFYKFNDDGLNPIGAQRVNKWFRANCDSARYFAVISFTDPFAPRIGWAFYNSAGSTNFDRVIFYDWQLDRWSYAEITAQYWSSLVTAGVTLEDLDVYGDIDSGGIPYPFDSRVWEGGAPVIGAVDSSGRHGIP
jgi:hypothetical protein